MVSLFKDSSRCMLSRRGFSNWAAGVNPQCHHTVKLSSSRLIALFAFSISSSCLKLTFFSVVQLGLAFSEAKRSEEYAFRLQKTSQPGERNATLTPETQRKGHKRTRRRRRQRKKTDPEAKTTAASSATSKKQHDAPMTKRDLYFCLRCGVVQVGNTGHDSAVGRVTLVNWDNQVVWDKFVKVPIMVADYRTETTGITEKHLESPEAITFDQARKKVAEMTKGKILIGHGLEVDLGALGLTHPWCDIRDTATYSPFMEEVHDGNAAPGHCMLLPQDLSSLADFVLNRNIAGCPIQEAIACLDLYKLARSEWEAELIKQVQHKEKQRQLVMSMRSGQTNMNTMSIPLSAIHEDEMPDSTILKKHDPRYLHTDPQRVFDRSMIGEECTLNSTEPTSTTTMLNSISYVEDDATSFISEDTDINSSVSSVSRFNSSGIYPEIENMEYVHEHTFMDGGNGFLPSASSERSTRGGRQGHHSPNPRPQGFNTSSVSPCLDVWHPSTDPLANGTSSTLHNSDDKRLNDQVSIQQGPTEEEMLMHLPSGLLADLEDGPGNISVEGYSSTLPTYEQKQPSKSTWFRSLRKPKSASSLSEGRLVSSSLLTPDTPQHPQLNSGSIPRDDIHNFPRQNDRLHQDEPRPKESVVLSIFRRMSLSGQQPHEQVIGQARAQTNDQTPSIPPGFQAVPCSTDPELPISPPPPARDLFPEEFIPSVQS